jgi:uncharacterized damage-inducible protein DinB
MRFAKWILLPALALPVFAQGYSESDRGKAISELEEGHRIISVLLESCTVKQSTFKPDSNRWSIVEILEHLALTEEMLFGTIKKNLENGKPSEGPPPQDPEVFDQLILKAVADRSQKATAPEQATPKGRYTDLDQARQAFGERRSKTVDWVRANKLPLRKYRSQSPIGEMDAHQWLLMLAAHTKRHAAQIEEVMQHPEYPKAQ